MTVPVAGTAPATIPVPATAPAGSGVYRVVSMRTHDIRFPTSLELDGSDAMNPDPDYSAAYVVLSTDDGFEGHGFAFTIGRGNEVQTAAIRVLEPYVLGRDAENMGTLWKDMVHDSQLRWLGPEKGVMHMAISAVVNALWDLKAKRAGKPLWLLPAEMSPEEFVALVDFRYLTDALTPEEALAILRAAEPGRRGRIAHLREHGYPAYTTSPGWLGDDDKLRRLCREAISSVQIDAARVAGVNENVAILLLAARFGVPVCPHAGGVGLCELVQHLSMFDYVAVSGSTENRVIEYVDHLREHFADPVVIENGAYVAPSLPGFGATMHASSIADHSYPDGPVWRSLNG
ncbi:enolase C-terminal domain-like protein [Streptosporangium sp. DT93]|uniref:enolase C-terminal domain-like protein n=1 Tax=Streptosporangium sp. DT93 TaxID=3393428 RepID=UPI003CF2C69D